MIAQIEANALGTAPLQAQVVFFRRLGVLIKTTNQSQVFLAFSLFLSKIATI